MKIEKLDKFEMKMPDELPKQPVSQPVLLPFNVIKPDPEPVETIQIKEEEIEQPENSEMEVAPLLKPIPIRYLN